MVYFGTARGILEIDEADDNLVFLISVLGKLKGEATCCCTASENDSDTNKSQPGFSC